MTAAKTTSTASIRGTEDRDADTELLLPVSDPVAEAKSLRAVAQQLIELASRLEGSAGSSESLTHVRDERAMLAEARAEYRARRQREQALPPGLISDPGWDILLDLYISRASGRKVSVVGACIASAVAEAPALRWIDQLERHDLIVRSEDAEGRAKAVLRLTDHGHAIVSEYFAAKKTAISPVEVWRREAEGRTIRRANG